MRSPKLKYLAGGLGLLGALVWLTYPTSLTIAGDVLVEILTPARTYIYPWEGGNQVEPTADDAIKYARLALAERESKPDEFHVLGKPRNGDSGSWLVQFGISDEFFKKGRWPTVWNVWLEFGEDEVEARISAPH